MNGWDRREGFVEIMAGNAKAFRAGETDTGGGIIEQSSQAWRSYRLTPIGLCSLDEGNA